MVVVEAVGSGLGKLLGEERQHVIDDVVVGRELLALGCGSGVHHDEGGAGVGAAAGDGRVAQSADVVDERGAGIEDGGGDRRLPRVDRNGDAGGDEAAHERHDARRFVGRVAGRRGGDARLAADIDDRRAVGDEGEGPVDLGVEARQITAVGEGVGAGVDDAHEERLARPELDDASREPQPHAAGSSAGRMAA